jgi:hypothetical protein
MNYTQSFEEFSRSVQPMDLALYAGIGVVLWVLFKDKTTPIQKVITDAINFVTTNVNSLTKKYNKQTTLQKPTNDVFFDLIVSWKQTRDLAVKAKCSEAVNSLDKIFPSLGPEACQETTETNDE